MFIPTANHLALPLRVSSALFSPRFACHEAGLKVTASSASYAVLLTVECAVLVCALDVAAALDFAAALDVAAAARSAPSWRQRM